jgi:hypothetical protein
MQNIIIHLHNGKLVNIKINNNILYSVLLFHFF